MNNLQFRAFALLFGMLFTVLRIQGLDPESPYMKECAEMFDDIQNDVNTLCKGGEA